MARMAGLLAAVLLAACNNSPHPAGAAKDNTLYLSFDERSPRYLDPTASYTSPESVYTYQIMEPPYGYHYLKRPYELIPRAAAAVVKPYYVDAQGKRLPDDAPVEQIAQSVYDVPLREGVKYAPSPAFAKDAQGRYLYHHLSAKDLGDKRSPWQFEHLGTREVEAEDFVYALKRHATTRVEAPIYGLFSEHVVGLKEYGALIREENAKLLKGLPESSPDKPFLDFRKWPLAGAEAVNKHLLRVRIKGKYPQWSYWLSTTFVAPIPWEVDLFYAQPGMAEHGLSWNQWPVGTGPYMMTEYQQDRRHVMSRNPELPQGRSLSLRGQARRRSRRPPGRLRQAAALHRQDRGHAHQGKGAARRCSSRATWTCPTSSAATGAWSSTPMPATPRRARRLLQAARLRVPAIDRPEQLVPRLQHARSGDRQGRRRRSTRPRHRKLRQALSIAIDWEEGYGRIFKNRGGVAAFGPVPPGVFGSREAQPGFFNPVTHKRVDGKDRAPLDRGGEAAACRGRLPRRPRCEDRPAAGAELRLHADAHARGEGRERLAGEAVRQAGRAARRARHRLQPVPGEAAQGKHQVFLVGLVRGLPGRGELPVPALRSQQRSRCTRARTRPTTRTPSTTACSSRSRCWTTAPPSSR